MTVPAQAAPPFRLECREGGPVLQHAGEERDAGRKDARFGDAQTDQNYDDVGWQKGR